MGEGYWGSLYDESRRNNTYLLAAALVSPGELARFRKFLRGLLMPGQHELHCKKETPSRRKVIASRRGRTGGEHEFVPSFSLLSHEKAHSYA